MKEGKKWILTNQKIDSENILYEWVSEPGACKVCQEMDGKIYESANDIPDRPHPNCKCHIELLEKEREVTDPIEIYQKQRREKQRVILEIQKAKGDILSMTEEIDEFLKQVDEEESKLTQLKNIVDMNNLEKEDIEKLNKAFEQVEFARFRGEKVKKELSNLHSQAVVLEGGVEKVRILVPLFEKILKEVTETLGRIIGTIENYIELMKKLIYVTWEQFKKDNYKLIRIVLNAGINIAGLGPLNDARELWNYSSFDGAQNYIAQNGKIISQVSELNNNKLETIVRTKLNSQFKIKEAVGIEFKADSTISQSIYKSNALKNFVRENKAKLDTQKRLQDDSLVFGTNDLNLYMALKRVAIVDIELDADKNLLAKIIDTYDFNNNEGNILVQLGNAVQEGNMLKPYYEIILLKIPYEEWIKF